ncbi:MAG: alpha-1,2-fucosyltransferase [Verrucomicrobia bacterium]|nr:alpha-1,2-fucosyltransferase [Verrucomicrobiota bacterium]
MMDQPLVTCRIYGQIGNQLFQIATTLAYAWDYGAVPIFPELHNKAWNISYNKDRLFFRLNASKPPRPFLHQYKEPTDFNADKIPFQKDLILDGYFQSWKHFHHHRDKLLSVFAPSPYTTEYLQRKYKDILADPNTVGIHVRTQCQRTHNTGMHPFWGLDYYQKQIELFPKDSTFVIFSDRINWCKKHFPSHSTFIEGNYGIEDLFLLASCKNNILCNSSFSWWAAYLNQNPSPKIIFPRNWRDPKRLPNPPAATFFLPEWSLSDYDTIHPFPTDMLAYDAYSQCIDNNV